MCVCVCALKIARSSVTSTFKRITDYRCQCHCYSTNRHDEKKKKKKNRERAERETKAYLVCRFNFYSSALQRAFLLKGIYFVKYM